MPGKEMVSISKHLGNFNVYSLVPMSSHLESVFFDSFKTYEEAANFINDYVHDNEFGEHFGFVIEGVGLLKNTK